MPESPCDSETGRLEACADLMGWLPIELCNSRSSGMIRWIQADAAGLSEPFFWQSIERLRTIEPPPSEREIPAELVRVAAARLGRIEPNGLIFHVSRCGSTLIANALRAGENTVVVSEAQPFNALLWPNSLTPYARRALFRCFARAFSHDAGGLRQRLVIKFSSWNIRFLPLIRSIWPGVPCVVMVRDPIEVMVSNLARPSGWMRLSTCPESMRHVFGWHSDTLQQMTLEEYCARGLGRFFEAANEAADESCKIVDYAALNTAKVIELGRYFGIDLRREADGLRDAINSHSKDRSRAKPFLDDRKTKHEEATEAVRNAAQKWAYPQYIRLKSA